MNLSEQLRDGVVYRPTVSGGGTHADNLTGSVDEPTTDAIMRQAADIIDQLPTWANSLVDAENQLYGIRHIGMAKDSIRYVEKKLRETAQAAGKET